MNLIVERRRFNSVGCRVMSPAHQKSPRSRQSGARSSSLGNITSRQSGAGVSVSPVRCKKSLFDNRKSPVGRVADRKDVQPPGALQNATDCQANQSSTNTTIITSTCTSNPEQLLCTTRCQKTPFWSLPLHFVVFHFVVFHCIVLLHCVVFHCILLASIASVFHCISL